MEERCLDKEDETAPTMEEAVKEARRCMNCGCFAVEPSDITPVLVALGATIHTTERAYTAQAFCCRKLKIDEVLAKGELATKVEIPVLEGAVMHYDKFRLREAVDWAIVSLASAFAKEEGRLTAAKLVLGGVAPIPVELHEVQGYLMGRTPDAETAKAAGELAVKECNALWRNRYKVHEVKVLVEKAVLRMQG